MSLVARASEVARRLQPEKIRTYLLDLTPRRRVVALVLLGLFSGLSAAPIHFFPALIVGLTGLIWLLDGSFDADRPMRSAAWRTFLFAGPYLGVGVFWVAFAFWNRGGAFIYFGPLVAIGGAAFLAAFWAAAGAIYGRLAFKGPIRIVAFAVLILAAEALKGLPFTQFPWNLPAHIFQAGGAVSQSAAWIGAWGLSFLVLLMFASPAALAGQGGETQKRLPVLMSLLLLAGLYGGGTQRLSSADVALETDFVFRIVDVDVDQRDKWGEGGADLVRNRYLELTASDGIEEVSHVIWPEGALPLFLIEDSVSVAALTEILTNDQVLLAGTPRRERDEAGRFTYYNAMVAMDFADQRPRVLGIYDKVRLVPFGEYVPLSGFLSSFGIQTLQELVAGYSHGAEFLTISDAGAPPFLPLICYEVVFNGIAPSGDERPAWMLNLSNDAWFGPTAGPIQHLNISRYRSIETGLPMIRAASRGYSGVIDPFGRNLVRLDRRYEGVTDVRLPTAEPPTLYVVTKGLLFWAIYILSILILVVFFMRNRPQS